MSNNKSTGLEVGNGCGLTLTSSAALYISKCLCLRLQNDLYGFGLLWFVFFFRKDRILSLRTAKLGAGQEFTQKWDSGRISCQSGDAHIPSKSPENWARAQLVFEHACWTAPFVQVQAQLLSHLEKQFNISQKVLH